MTMRKKRKPVPVPRSSFFQTTARLQREANSLKKQRLEVEKKRNAILEGVSNELALLRHAYYAVNNITLNNEI